MSYIGSDALRFEEDGVEVVEHSGGPKVIGNNHDGTKLMQFTGLLDKDGTEIYEGDIIKDGEWVQRVPDILELLKQAFIESAMGSYTDGKVIGNIFQNPELLKKYKWIEN